MRTTSPEHCQTCGDVRTYVTARLTECGYDCGARLHRAHVGCEWIAWIPCPDATAAADALEDRDVVEAARVAPGRTGTEPPSCFRGPDGVSRYLAAWGRLGAWA